jgi:hypothetical protein
MPQHHPEGLPDMQDDQESRSPTPQTRHEARELSAPESHGVRSRPLVVVLCGSTRFKDSFIEANFRETMAGRIVLSVGWFGHADGHVYTPTAEEKAALDELHLRKIDRADEVLVVNPPCRICVGCGKPCGVTEWGNSDCCAEDTIKDSYVGESTRREIAYAEAKGKPVRYLRPS